MTTARRDHSVDPSALDELLSRLEMLEAREAIHSVLVRCLNVADTLVGEARGSAMADLYTEKAIWETEIPGHTSDSEVARADPRIVGREEIRKKFSRTDRNTFRVHYMTNEVITVNGATGVATFLIFGPLTYKNVEPYWQGSQVQVELIRTGSTWLISHRKSRRLFLTPFDEGWVKRQFAALP